MRRRGHPLFHPDFFCCDEDFLAGLLGSLMDSLLGSLFPSYLEILVALFARVPASMHGRSSGNCGKDIVGDRICMDKSQTRDISLLWKQMKGRVRQGSR